VAESSPPVDAPVAAKDWDVKPTIEWLVHEGRLIPEAPKLIDELAKRLVAAGAPLWRVRLGLQAIHPLYRTMGLLWRRGEAVQQEGRPHGIEKTSDYIGSPIQQLIETRRPVRYRLDRLSNENHEMLHALAAAGGTDYYAAPMRVPHGKWPAITFATDRKGGFTDADIGKLHGMLDYLAPITEGHIGHLVTTTLMNTYLGRIVGEQILAGQIKRGDGQSINAVLWFSDLRDFTGLNERLAAPDLLELLNNYLQLVGDALSAHGGEILKFIGDGVMGYFPAEDALFLPMVTGNAVRCSRTDRRPQLTRALVVDPRGVAVTLHIQQLGPHRHRVGKIRQPREGAIQLRRGGLEISRTHFGTALAKVLLPLLFGPKGSPIVYSGRLAPPNATQRGYRRSQNTLFTQLRRFLAGRTLGVCHFPERRLSSMGSASPPGLGRQDDRRP
jgi:adenylate cyclase